MTERMTELQERYLAASAEDKDVIVAVMADIIDMVTSDEGGGILFADVEGDGRMNVHLIGNTDLAPEMLRAAPSLYQKFFGVPEGVPQQ